MPSRSQRRVLVAACLAGLIVLAFTAGWAFAQMPPPMPTRDERTPATAMTHEQMHRMMDAMHGEGASDRMHEMMGEEGDQMMDQCVAMMNMMGGMGRMGDNPESMEDMMRRMMGR